MPRKSSKKRAANAETPASEAAPAPATAAPAQSDSPDSVNECKPIGGVAVPFSISPPQGSLQGGGEGSPRKGLNCIVYVRTSTLEQSTGAQTQIELCNKAISLMDKEDGKKRKIIETVVDENASGDVMPERRANFPRILTLIAEGKIDELWMHSRDRLSRNVDMLGYARIILQEKGVAIRCLDDTDDQALGRVKDLFGEMELKKYREKSAQGTERALRNGTAMFRPPFGYKSSLDGKLVVDEEKKTLCVSVLRAIESNVNPRKVAALYGVSDALVRRMRKNPIYRTGEVYYAGKMVFKVEPIYPVQPRGEEEKVEEKQ